MSTRIADLAAHVVAAERQGTLDGWRAYLMDQFKREGASTEQIKQAIERARKNDSRSDDPPRY